MLLHYGLVAPSSVNCNHWLADLLCNIGIGWCVAWLTVVMTTTLS